MRAAREVRDAFGQRYRYAHVVRVARLAERLAVAHGEDPGRARVAGLLHDLARLWPVDRLLAESERRGLALDAFERENPIVVHARLGAELARERYGCDDEAVLSAIRKHTLADGRMSTLDAIVYLADGLEPGRDFPERADLLKLAFRDVRAAMRGTLVSSIADNRRRGSAVAACTLDAAARYGADLPEEERTPA